jgi:hypothetical protein
VAGRHQHAMRTFAHMKRHICTRHAYALSISACLLLLLLLLLLQVMRRQSPRSTAGQVSVDRAEQSRAGNKPWNLDETRRCRLPALGSVLRARLWVLDADQAAGFEKQWSENHDRHGFNNGGWGASLYGSILFVSYPPPSRTSPPSCITLAYWAVKSNLCPKYVRS